MPQAFSASQAYFRSSLTPFSSSHRILNNYLVWQTVKTLTGYLSKAFRDAYKGLRKALFGSEGGEEPWKFCVSDTNSVLGFALGAMYVREVFNGNSKPMVICFLLYREMMDRTTTVCHLSR